MYRYLILFFGSFVSLSNATSQDKAKLKVLATASMFADMAKNIAGDLVNIDIIVPIGSDPHLYEPTPEDAVKVAQADLILINGLTFEGWLSELIENSGTKADQSLITEGIEAIKSVIYTGSTDPHAWMSALNGITYSSNIHKALIKLDPENREQYDRGLSTYIQKLKDLHGYILQTIQSIPEKHRFLITSHDAFQYFGRSYGIQLESILGVSTDADVQTTDVLRVSRLIEKNKIPALFIESTINPKLMQQLAKDRHTRIGGKLYADSLGDKNSPASTYIEMLKYNADTIVNGLMGNNEEIENDNNENGLPIWSYLLFAFLLIALLFFVFRKMSNS